MGQLYSCCVTEICPGEAPPTPELLAALAPYSEAVDELRAAKDSAAACSACERLGDLVLEAQNKFMAAQGEYMSKQTELMSAQQTMMVAQGDADG